MKKIIIGTIFLVLTISTLCQNGTYRCNIQRFEDENDSLNNKEHHNSMIIIIDINDYTGGSITVSWPNEDFTFKWDILKKLNTSVDSENKTVITYYEARFNIANGRSSKRSVAYIIQDLNDNSLHIAVNNPDAGTTNWYHNLTKFVY